MTIAKIDKTKIMIVDSCVAAKWFFEEELSSKAEKMLNQIKKEKIRIVVPEFFYIEMANICWKQKRIKSMPEKEIFESMDKIMKLPFESYASYDLADVALENAFIYHVSAYDGLYLALAEIYLAPLITADRKFYDACRRKQFPFIEYLGNIC